MAEEPEESSQPTEETNKITDESEKPTDTTTIPATAAPNSPVAQETSSFDEHEILSEQFDNYLRIAEALMKTLKRPKDIEICSNLLRKVQKLNDSKHLEVKRNNNAFFRYCLRVLKWTSDNQPLVLYQQWYRHKEEVEGQSSKDSRIWLEDNKSYMALASLKDGINIIYAAVSDDPTAGWHEGGLDILSKRAACPRN